MVVALFRVIQFTTNPGSHPKGLGQTDLVLPKQGKPATCVNDWLTVCDSVEMPSTKSHW